MSPFDIVKILNEKTTHDTEEVLADYNAWIINRAMSSTVDGLIFANEMTKFSHLDKDIQYSFYLYGIPKGKRFGKWNKADTTDLELINTLCKTLVCNQAIAKKYLSLLSDEQKQHILSGEGGNNGRSNNRGTN
jgi:hypothetical protein